MILTMMQNFIRQWFRNNSKFKVKFIYDIIVNYKVIYIRDCRFNIFTIIDNYGILIIYESREISSSFSEREISRRIDRIGFWLARVQNVLLSNYQTSNFHFLITHSQANTLPYRAHNYPCRPSSSNMPLWPICEYYARSQWF